MTSVLERWLQHNSIGTFPDFSGTNSRNVGKPHLDAAVCRRMFGCDEVAMTFSLTNVQQDPTYSVYYISVGSATCFGC